MDGDIAIRRSAMGPGEVNFRCLLIFLTGLIVKCHDTQDSATKIVQFEAAFQGLCLTQLNGKTELCPHHNSRNFKRR